MYSYMYSTLVRKRVGPIPVSYKSIVLPALHEVSNKFCCMLETFIKSD